MVGATLVSPPISILGVQNYFGHIEGFPAIAGLVVELQTRGGCRKREPYLGHCRGTKVR